MKHLLVASLLTVGVVAPAWAQQQPLPVDSTTHKITYSAVVQVPGVSQAELYGRALRWLATVEARNTNVPPITDAVSGTLVATVGQPFTGRAVVGTMQYTLWRQVSIRVKEGRAKYEFSDFQVQPYVAGSSTMPPNQVQLKLTPAEAYLNRSNTIYYNKQGQPKPFVAAILEAVEQQGTLEAAGLKKALTTLSDF